MNTPLELVTLAGLARRLRRYGITASWLQTEAEARRIPSMQAGRLRLFSVESVEAALLRRAAGEGVRDDA